LQAAGDEETLIRTMALSASRCISTDGRSALRNPTGMTSTQIEPRCQARHWRADRCVSALDGRDT